MAQPPLERGDRAPNFVLADLNGAFRLFYDLTRGTPCVVALLRAADPKAAETLAALKRAAADFAGADTDIFAVVQGGPAEAAALGKDAPFPVFVDIEGKVNAVYPVSGESGGRKTVVIDENQRVLEAFAGGDPDGEIAHALAFVREIWRRPEAFPAGRVAPVLLIPDVFDPALREALMAAWAKQHEEMGVSGSTDAVLYERKKSQDHLVREPAMIRRISETLNRRVMPEVIKAFTFKGPYGFDGHIVLGYEAGRQDFFGMHRDNMSPRTRHRRFAISLNLNDDFEGGELRFPEYGGALYALKAGMACVFSCSLLHEALPVRRGRRLALTTFMCDPPEQKPGPAKA
jgi:peroxiredoxin/predicted 2-oxoglutarate/Fe(II)-dependent dioxygenase YbiX